MKNIWKEHADKVLMTIAVVMGISYPVAKSAMSGDWGHFKFTFLSLRFMLAFAVLIPFAKKTLSEDMLRYSLGSLLVGISLVATYGFQYAAFAVITTTSGSVAFIMASKVVVVTLLTAILWKAGLLKLKENPITSVTLVGVALTTIGLQVFTYQPGFHLTRGEWLAASAMVGYALFLILFSECGRRGLKPIPLVAGASLVIAIVTGLIGVFFELRASHPKFDWRIILAIIWMGLVPGALGLLALYRVTADETRRAIILSLEPVFAALCGVLLLHEQFRGSQVFGSLLILLGVMLKPLIAIGRSPTTNIRKPLAAHPLENEKQE